MRKRKRKAIDLNSPRVSASGPLKIVFHALFWPGLVVFALGVASTVRTVLFVANAVETTATVVKVEKHWSPGDEDRSGSWLYTPTFRYTAGGRERVVTLDHSGTEYDYDPGDTVAVRYRPEEPRKVRVASVFGIWFGSLITLGIGTMIPLMALAVLKAVHAAEAAFEAAEAEAAV